jgi:hypothetical protein
MALADEGIVSEYYGDGFAPRALKKAENVETIPKKDLLDSLERATRKTRKGRYSKGTHAYELLEKVDPEILCRRARGAKAFADAVRKRSSVP